MTTTSDLTRRRRIGVLLICSMSLFIVGLDITAVNVALPAIGHDLGAELSWLQWSVSAYTVVMASLLLFSGSMADRLGRKKTLSIGLSVFTIASALCSLAPNVELLVAARVLQGIGASMLNPVAMSIITNTFTDRRERAQAVGVWGAVFGASMAAGPIIGGALVSTVGWQWIFVINVPVGLAAIALLARYVPESKAPAPRRFDPVGQLLVVVALATMTYGIIEAPGAGWASPQILAAFSATLLSALGLALYEPRRQQPLIDLRFFRSIPFSSSIALSVAAFAAFGGFLFLNTLYLQDVRGLSAIDAGITIVPLALMTVVLSPISGRMVGRDGPRKPLLIAGSAFFVASTMLVQLDPTTPLPWLIAAYVVFGIGFGFVNAPITNAAVSGMPVAQAGVAAAIATTSRQFGQAIGVAVIGAIIASDAGPTTGTAMTDASHAAWWTLAGLGALVFALGAIATGTRAQRSGRIAAARLSPETIAA
jgi:EmrB/QacA subfamily drug resistance transporter